MPNNENFKSNVFSIEEKERVDLVPGYLQEKVDTTLISDGDSAKDRASINKMCTSIPTPFARLFLFRTAFKEIKKRQRRLLTQGTQVHLESGLYNYMVSDCLDMLEFIFYYGANEKFNVVAWNRQSELDQLSSDDPNFSHSEDHDRLAHALRDQFDPKIGDQALKHVNTIYLFTWNDNPKDPKSLPVVVGGTSPFSLAYTSPNWVREKSQKRWEFKAGKGGDNLFDNDPTKLTPPRALSQRSERFKEYIYKMWFAYKGRNNSLTDFEDYLSQSWELYDKDTPFGARIAGLEGAYTIKDFLAEYTEQLHSVTFNDKGKADDSKIDAIVIGDSPNGEMDAWRLRCLPTVASRVNDDYKIKCSHLPKEASGQEAAKTVEMPLVLDPNVQIGGALYYEDEPWSIYCGKMPSIQVENPNYWERTLPGTERPYPYLRIEDFLEDKIIGLAAHMSNKHFLTGNAGDVNFLPPLKRTFFKFFNLEDLYQFMNDGSFKYDNKGIPVQKQNIYSIHIIDDETVTVTLNIPVQSGVITMKKTYSDDEIVFFDDADADRHFNLSIFPFYQIVDNPNNKYSVMLGYAGKVELNFFRMNDLNHQLKTEQRERTNTNTINTRFYMIDDAFDVIEVETGEARGLIIPLFKRIKLGTDHMVFCVDFGTTNTHVAYGKDNGNTVDDVQDFFYTESDEQVVSLYDIGSYIHYKPAMKREFLPEEIVVGNNDEKLSFPIRTTACAAKSWLSDTDTNKYMLFGDTNVGFFFLHEEQSAQGSNVYKQNIKWARGGKNPDLRQAYFDELMWMIKNKAVLNGASLDFNFYFTYPQSMEGRERDRLYITWAEARKHVKAGDPGKCNMKQSDMKHPVEGIVPWYAFRKQGLIDASEIYLNVDIGGGTVDMVYQDPDHEENYTYSARFAANDLWGDGIDDQSDKKKANAFITEYVNKSFPSATNLTKRYETFRDNASDSADIASFLFKYDKDYRFTEHLQESPLITLILMHFVSITYYIGLILKKDGLYVPQKIGFTGMGSLYINILSPLSRDIAELMKSVLRYQGFEAKEVEPLEVVMTDNPKVVTAKGGVIFHRPGQAPLTQVESCVWGYDGETDTDRLMECDVPNKIESVLTQVEDCMNYFSSDEFSKVRSKLNRGWNYQPLDMGEIMRLARLSFKNWDASNNDHSNDMQKDPIFFWPIKDMLFKYGFKI